MAEFNYLNYYTIYSCVGDVDHEMDNDSCFHTVTKDDCKPFMDNHYTIRFYHDINYIRDNCNNNFCSFNIHELMAILGMISSYRKFEFHVTDAYDTMKYIENIEDNDDYDDDNNYDTQYKYYELDVHIKDSLIWHKFILKMIRSLYEYPFNMAMVDVLRLMNIEKFQQYGLFNIYMMVGFTLAQSSSISMCDDQFVCSRYNGIPKFMQRPALIKRINDIQKQANENNTKAIFNDIVEYNGNPNEIKDYFENRFVDTSDVKDYKKYWCDPEMFEERLDIYNEVLKYFIP